MNDSKKMEPRPPVDPAKLPDNATEDFKADVQKASEELAAQVAAFKEFWTEWMPGGLRKRKRFRTKGHGLRRAERRRKNKVARASRKRNRPHKKGGR
jgi:hypothetical protein